MQSQSQEFEVIPVSCQSQQFQVLADNPDDDPTPLPPIRTVVVNNINIVMWEKDVDARYTKQQWDELLGCRLAKRKDMVSVIGLNSVICLNWSDQTRHYVWQRVVEEQPPTKYQQHIELPPVDKLTRREVENNTKRMFQKLRLQQLPAHQSLRVSTVEIVLDYVRQDQMLVSTKGLEYICLGVHLCTPNSDPLFVKHMFRYMMESQNIRDIFWPGSPLFYEELSLLQEQIRTYTPRLHSALEQLDADWPKLFVAYYRTLLLNRTGNPHIVMKIIDLVLVFGVAILRTLLTRMLAELEERLLALETGRELMEVVAVSLLDMYFQPAKLQAGTQEQQCQQVISQFRKLIMEV